MSGGVSNSIEITRRTGLPKWPSSLRVKLAVSSLVITTTDIP